VFDFEVLFIRLEVLLVKYYLKYFINFFELISNFLWFRHSSGSFISHKTSPRMEK